MRVSRATREILVAMLCDERVEENLEFAVSARSGQLSIAVEAWHQMGWHLSRAPTASNFLNNICIDDLLMLDIMTSDSGHSHHDDGPSVAYPAINAPIS